MLEICLKRELYFLKAVIKINLDNGKKKNISITYSENYKIPVSAFSDRPSYFLKNESVTPDKL